MGGKKRAQSLQVKEKRKQLLVAPVRKPALTDEQKEALRRKKQALQKQAGVEAHALVKKYVKRLKEKLLQPSRKHYGGLGYAKESVFLEFGDPKYADSFQSIWDEHIPGFSGKSFKKRKTEAGSSMLWRQRLEAKASGAQLAGPDQFVSKLTSKSIAPKSRPQAEQPTVKRRTKAAALPAPTPNQPSHAKKRKKVDPVIGDAAMLQSQAIAAYRRLKASKGRPQPP